MLTLKTFRHCSVHHGCVTGTSWGRSHSWRLGRCTDLSTLASQILQRIIRQCLLGALLKMLLFLGDRNFEMDQLLQMPVAAVAPARQQNLLKEERTRTRRKRRAAARNSGTEPFSLPRQALFETLATQFLLTVLTTTTFVNFTPVCEFVALGRCDPSLITKENLNGCLMDHQAEKPVLALTVLTPTPTCLFLTHPPPQCCQEQQPRGCLAASANRFQIGRAHV